MTPTAAQSFATLTDAEPLIALIDADEPDHERCKEALQTIRLNMRLNDYTSNRLQ